MSSSDDDMPLAGKANNGQSPTKISKAVDAAMDKEVDSSKSAPVGISIRNGPVTDDAMDVDHNGTNGKRKARTSNVSKSYKEDDGSEDDIVPLTKRQKIKKEESDSDDAPIARRKSNGAKLPPKIESSSDDEPLGMKLSRKKASIEKKAEKEAKAIRAHDNKIKKEESSGDDDAPLAKKSKAAPPKPSAKAAPKKKAIKNEVKDESDDDKPLAKKTNGKAKASVPKKSAAAKAEEEEEEEEYAWWNAEKREDDSIKWDTLQHQGVVFPPPYEPLPKNVKLKYNGVPLTLEPAAEEVAGFFGAMLNSTHNVENPTFIKNFFNDFKTTLKGHGGAKDRDGKKVEIKDFDKLNFQDIFAYYQGRSEERKARPAAEKKEEKRIKDEAEAKYIYCTWDGRKEKVGNFRVEPPGLFRGRGEHPKTGMVKQRVTPEQITINIGKDAIVPSPPEGHKWKEIRHDNRATWLAMWQENINGAYKYVMLAANSSIKGQSDLKKFEKARELKKHIDKIRKDYTKELKADLMADRQRATAVYLIDRFALRAGNEKDADNEAETVGCCSLKYEHVRFDPSRNNVVIFDFLGKDSIRFYDEVVVEEQVYKNLKIFKKAPKKEGDDIFDRLSTTQLNKHLTNYMPGLSAKVFRTYNASYTMSTLLNELKNKKGLSIAEKIKLYNDCNRKVAILCNHKRTVGTAHEQQMDKMIDGIKAIKYQMWRTKQMILDCGDKDELKELKKKKGADWFSLESHDIDEDWVKEHQTFLQEDLKSKIEKKFAKDNEKLVAEGEKEMKATELKERLKAVDELAAKFKVENKKNKIAAEGKGPSVEKYLAAIEKLETRVTTKKLLAEDKEENKEVALGTSKINYIDPRLTVVFAKRFDVPIEKFFSKTLRDKFNWAIKSIEDTDDWEF